ncbi:MAG: replication initiation protein [Cetobacterium sp.]
MKIVKYHNDINKLRMGHFTEREINMFFALILKARDSEEKTITIDFTEIKNLIEGYRGDERLIDNIRSLNLKLKALVQEVQDINGDYIAFSLFDNIIVRPSKKVLETSINPMFKHMIKDLIGNFTMLDFTELVSLRGSYPKTLYRLLKQWESTNQYLVTIEEFRELMNIPKTYEFTNITQKILNPAMKELEKFFPKLKLQKIKKGVKIDSLVFTWANRVKTKEKLEKIGFIERKQGASYEEYLEIESKKEEKIIENLEEIDVEKLSEDEEKRALDLLGNEMLFAEMKRRAEGVYWKTLKSVLDQN